MKNTEPDITLIKANMPNFRKDVTKKEKDEKDVKRENADAVKLTEEENKTLFSEIMHVHNVALAVATDEYEKGLNIVINANAIKENSLNISEECKDQEMTILQLKRQISINRERAERTESELKAQISAERMNVNQKREELAIYKRENNELETKIQELNLHKKEQKKLLSGIEKQTVETKAHLNSVRLRTAVAQKEFEYQEKYLTAHSKYDETIENTITNTRAMIEKIHLQMEEHNNKIYYLKEKCRSLQAESKSFVAKLTGMGIEPERVDLEADTSDAKHSVETDMLTLHSVLCQHIQILEKFSANEEGTDRSTEEAEADEVVNSNFNGDEAAGVEQNSDQSSTVSIPANAEPAEDNTDNDDGFNNSVAGAAEPARARYKKGKGKRSRKGRK